MALSPEILVPRLGEVLVSEALITTEQLDLALAEQKRISSNGAWHRIGDVLIDLGFISRDSLNQAITRQILRFQQALLEANRNLEARVAERTAELESAYRKLSELDLLKSNFISGVSHELRTPLTHIKGYVELLLSSDNLSTVPDLEQSLLVMQRSTERLENLINDLIMFSAAENGQLMLCLESFNIKEVLALAISRYAKQALSKKVNIRLDCKHDEVLVNADKNKITWVINQLLDNAVKYTKQAGEITTSLNVMGATATLAVEDNGAGMTRGQVEDAFMPFHQLNGNINRPQGGTGIGLALAKRIVEAHGSEILVVTAPGKGSRFEFKMTLSQ